MQMKRYNGRYQEEGCLSWAPDLQGVAPPLPQQPVSREIKGAETHWLAMTSLGAPLMTGQRQTVTSIMNTDRTKNFIIHNYICNYTLYILVCHYAWHRTDYIIYYWHGQIVYFKGYLSAIKGQLTGGSPTLTTYYPKHTHTHTHTHTLGLDKLCWHNFENNRRLK